MSMPLAAFIDNDDEDDQEIAKIMKEAMAFYRILILSYADREALLLNCGPLNCGSN